MTHARDINIPALTLAPRSTATPRSQRPPRRVNGYFVRGPVPWAWIVAAGRIPGKALHVGMALWFRAGRTNAVTVTISLTAVAAELGIDRSTASRALASLAAGGLVSVEHAPGRKCSVTVLLPADTP